jgi:hypothetical protein
LHISPPASFDERGGDMTATLPHTNRTGNRLNELFDRIVRHIQEMSGNQLSEQEAIEAARNWLGFCSKLQEIEKDMQEQVLEP